MFTCWGQVVVSVSCLCGNWLCESLVFTCDQSCLVQDAQSESLNVNFKLDLHLLDPGNSDCKDGLSLEHFPVGLHCFDTQGLTGSVHVKSPHQT